VAQNRVARDSYSYLHLPLIAGIVLIALGIKKTLLHVDEPLHAAPAAALGGGVALYLIGHVLFRLRNVRTWNKQRVVVAVVCLALIPVLQAVDALPALAIIAAVLASLITYEATRFREARDRIRHAAPPLSA
jgi:low temperature requirement protein LtrA